jgi:predicted GIY-YIG superfamily endonuclease
MRWRHKAVEPAAEPPRADILRLDLSTRRVDLYEGWGVYLLADADGVIFYIGESESFIARLAAHAVRWGVAHRGNGGRIVTAWWVPVRDEWQAHITELMLIDRYQPAENDIGTTAALRAKVSSMKSAHNGGNAKALQRKARSLDRSQETA